MNQRGGAGMVTGYTEAQAQMERVLQGTHAHTLTPKGQGLGQDTDRCSADGSSPGGRGGHPVLDPPHFRCTHFGISSFVTDPRQKGWGKPVPIRGSCGRADDSACGSFAGLQQRTSRRVLFERLVAQLHLEVGVCRCRQLSTTLKHFQRLLAACARRCQS